MKFLRWIVLSFCWVLKMLWSVVSWPFRATCYVWFQRWQRQVGLATHDTHTSEWIYLKQKRHFSGDVTLYLHSGLTLQDIDGRLRQFGRYYQSDESFFLQAVDLGKNRVRLCGPRSLPALKNFHLSQQKLRRILRGKHGHIFLGRSIHGWLLVNCEDKCLNVCFGRPGGGKSLAAAWIIQSLLISDPISNITVFDASAVDFGRFDDTVERLSSLFNLLIRLKIIRDECLARKELLQTPEMMSAGVTSVAQYEKATSKILPRYYILLDECQRYLARSVDKNDPHANEIREIQAIVIQLVTEFRKFGVIFWLFGVESKSGELVIPFNSIFVRMSSHLAFPETSQTLFGSDIACRRGLTQGRMVVSVDHNPIIVQLPLPLKPDSKV